MNIIKLTLDCPRLCGQKGIAWAINKFFIRKKSHILTTCSNIKKRLNTQIFVFSFGVLCPNTCICETFLRFFCYTLNNQVIFSYCSFLRQFSLVDILIKISCSYSRNSRLSYSRVNVKSSCLLLDLKGLKDTISGRFKG